LKNPEYLISSQFIVSESTLMIPSNPSVQVYNFIFQGLFPCG